MFFSVELFFSLLELAQVDEEENGGLHGLAEVLLNYGERHFEGAPGSKEVRTGLWAAVLLTCGEFERVSDNEHISFLH
jgi:nuclear pore complex protein Nup93